MKSHEINTDGMCFSVDDDEFAPDTEYSARIRSSPNQAFYKGWWSNWSSEVHWRTEPAVDGESPRKNAADLKKMYISRAPFSKKHLLLIDFFGPPFLMCVFKT